MRDTGAKGRCIGCDDFNNAFPKKTPRGRCGLLVHAAPAAAKVLDHDLPVGVELYPLCGHSCPVTVRGVSEPNRQSLPPGCHLPVATGASAPVTVATGTGASARNPVFGLGSLASSPESSRGTRASVTARVRLLKSAGEREKCAAAASAFERRRFPGLLDSESRPLWQPVAA